MTFLPPTYIKKRNKTFAMIALKGISMLFRDNFKYTRETVGDRVMLLEFETFLENDPKKMIRGIDIITVNEKGKISQFEVMMRPPKTVQYIGEFQTKFLTKLGVIKAKPKL